jgi:hypothetical protein
MIRWPARSILLALASLAVATWGVSARQQSPSFPHAAHAKLFVSCATCHAGIEQPGAPVFPTAGACTSCHDGAIVKRVDWQPRIGARVSNLRFDHPRHASARTRRGDTTSCGDCHADPGARWMTVRAPTAAQCVTCHSGGRATHLTAPDTACATCHVPLARATSLPTARVAAFPKPPTHTAPGFLTADGHGAQARHTAGTARVAESCATCHAREFCAACHVNAPEVPTIQALEPDQRSLALPHALKAPATHAAADFEARHGPAAGRSGASCRTCHTQESCLTCHRAETPPTVQALYHAGPGRAAGAQTVPRTPASHTAGWKTQHGPVASAGMRSCTSCHARIECLTCHQPDPARRGSYHPAAYLARHPADAYTRSSSCNDCHNAGEFCQTCHKQGGLTARRTLLGAAGYHDGNRQFFLGHGQAARQALESCVSCHVERDCLTCHSVVRGRSFNPHGPGFNPTQMLKKNPQLCIACHGTAIPTGSQ